jgi:O-antigen ligase/polysaccharide polymerase Wzy-like membrane protein
VFGLAFDGGTYALTSRNAVAIGVWWALALAVALSVWPLERPTRAAISIGGLLAAFALLTGLSLIWAESAEKAFAELDRVLLYLGAFVVAVAAGRRGNARRWRDGMAIGLVAVSALALASRLYPDLVSEQDLATLLPGIDERLAYPVDYWNGLAILVGLAFPLLLGCATERRRPAVGALAVAPIPVLVAVIYLASSRGGAATAIVGTVIFVALSPHRLAALAAAVCAGAGSAAVIAILGARPELVDGPLNSAAAASQGSSAARLIALVFLVTGLAYGLGSKLAPRLRIELSPALRRGLAIAVVLAAVGGIVAADPVERFDRFKRPPSGSISAEGGFTESHLLSEGGSGRWQFWSAAVDEYESRPLVGRGAGSFEAWWAEHASFSYFIRDAHSLYAETLGELGLIGLALLLAVFGGGLGVAAQRLRRQTGDTRSPTVVFAATFVAFMFGAAIDWVWELTVVGVIGVVCLGLLCGPATAVPGRLGGADGTEAMRPRVRRPPILRSGFALFCLAVIVAQAIPLLAQSQIRASQEAAARGDGSAALESALAARRFQGWAASPHLQIALVEEQRGNLAPARRAITEAIERDRSDWRSWLVSARLEAKSGHPGRAREQLRQARRLNRRSPLLRAASEAPTSVNR